MSGCLVAQQAQRRIVDLEDEVAELRQLLMILAQAAGVDVRRLLLVDRVERRGGFPLTWEECEALGLDPAANRAGVR